MKVAALFLMGFVSCCCLAEASHRQIPQTNQKALTYVLIDRLVQGRQMVIGAPATGVYIVESSVIAHYRGEQLLAKSGRLVVGARTGASIEVVLSEDSLLQLYQGIKELSAVRPGPVKINNQDVYPETVASVMDESGVVGFRYELSRRKLSMVIRGQAITIDGQQLNSLRIMLGEVYDTLLAWKS